MKKPMIISAIFLLSMFVAVQSASAGNPNRHRPNGFTIGYNGIYFGAPDSHYDGHNHHPPHPRGHWEHIRVWVPPQYKQVWKPAYYSPAGRPVGGSWVTVMIRPGGWIIKKVWVSHQHRF